MPLLVHDKNHKSYHGADRDSGNAALRFKIQYTIWKVETKINIKF